VETLVHEESPAARRRAAPAAGNPPVSLAEISETDVTRIPVGIGELDRVLGGGLVPGSLVLVGGEPGIGKSTLLLQAAAGLSTAGPILYATGEESSAQVRLRAARLGLLGGAAAVSVTVYAESSVARILETARAARPVALIVDSIQTATVDELEGPAGSVGQVRESALRYMELAKGDGIAVLLVGHVTKEGSLAGPKTLEHLVDAVLSVEGDRSGALRLVRATKNRFGSTEEVGVLEMAEAGLREVPDPARAFLVEHDADAPGSVVGATLEGSLVAPTVYGTPRRTAIGIDPGRLALLVAVLGRRAGIGLGSHDVYANLAGGLAADDPGLDLAVAIALASTLRDLPVAAGTVAIGEIGLLGELRSVTGLERRLREAARLGFTRALVPPGGHAQLAIPGIAVLTVRTIREALGAALGPAGG
jgi:DNA repair protein RadA/Sms